MDYNLVIGLMAATAGLIAASTALLRELRAWRKADQGKRIEGGDND